MPFLFLQQKIQKVRSADERDHNARRNAGRIDEIVSDGIGEQEQPSANQHGDRDEMLVTASYDRLGDMGYLIYRSFIGLSTK